MLASRLTQRGEPSPPRAARALTVAALLVAHAGTAPAQLSGSNLLIGQVGTFPKSFPDRGASNRQDFYDQVNLGYSFASGIAGLRFETYRNSEDEFAYEGVAQRYLDWTDRGYRIRVGNFYTLLGHGLIHRSFELSGVVLDKRGIRTRYAPARDVDGVLAEATVGSLSAILFSGSPSVGDVSLAEEKLGNPRHRGQISGGQLMATLYREASVGAAYTRGKAGFDPRTGLSRQEEIGSGFVDVDPLRLLGVEGVSLPIYAEYAAKGQTFSRWWDWKTSDRTSHALYSSANLIWGTFGLSAEWKDYSDFRLGTNDPPSLVREHSPTLLNRSTHVLDAQLEEGFQLEASYTASEWASLVANLSRTDEILGGRFEERYVELHSAPRSAKRWEATAFYDRSWDHIDAIADRRTVGLVGTVRFLGRLSGTVDFQRQTARRDPRFSDARFENLYLSWMAAAADLGSLAMVWERTTDELDPSWPEGRTQPLDNVGWVLSARLAPRHEAMLFAGKRRGGRACTAGTCYEVQPFEGVELRLVSRL